jgi:acyl-CoA synthetase (AMP-forming)/AMP-acid ligase II
MKARSIADLSRVGARHHPDQPAVLCQGRALTYAELDLRASQVANGLRVQSPEPGRRIAYLGRNSEIFFELLLGAAKARWAMIPLNWRLAAPEIDFIVGDAAPDILVVEPEFLGVAGQLSSAPLLLPVHDRLGGYAHWRDAQPSVDPMAEGRPDDNVVVMYTSGTTGLPKGAQLSDANLMAHLHYIDAGAFGAWAPGDIQLICLPIFHIGGTDSGLWSFYTGGTVLLLTDANVPTLLGAFRDHRVAVAGFVPTIMKTLLDRPEIADIDFSAMKLVSYGGSPISVELMQQARSVFGCRFQQLFGMTETTGGVAILRDEDHLSPDRTLLKSCGKPLPTIELKVVDGEGREVPAGVAGEVVVRGPVVTKGYWRREEQSAEALRGGWYHSGDVGTLDERGYLFIHDRIKDMVVSGGENVYPTEVENALILHAAVAEVAVIGVPDPKWGEAVKAFVVPVAGEQVGEAELIAFARTRLAGYKCPKSVDLVEALPRNASGKVLRRELRKLYWGEGRQVG